MYLNDKSESDQGKRVTNIRICRIPALGNGSGAVNTKDAILVPMASQSTCQL